MKKILFLFLFIPMFIFGQGRQFSQSFIVGDTYSYPTLIDTPVGYNSPINITKRYPLFVFLHGAGEGSMVASLSDPAYQAGAYLNKIYNSNSAGGIPYAIAHQGWNYDAIAIAPQSVGWSTTGVQLDRLITSVLAAGYRIDENHIYYTGLSAGGQGLYDLVTHRNDQTSFVPLHLPAAIIPMSPAIGTPTNQDVAFIKNAKIHVWAFGSESDIYGVEAHLLVTGSYQGNNGPTPPALDTFGRFTPYIGGHCCWVNWYATTYTELINGRQMNIYDWALQYSRALPSLPITLKSLTADVQEDQSITIAWETSIESNVDHFVIQQSEDGKNFTDIVSVHSKAFNGNSSVTLSYSVNL